MMMSTEPTLQSILNTHLEAYNQTHPLDKHRRSVCRHIRHCRTAAMGGVQFQCNHCGDEPVHYFACRDRHCPLCQQRATDEWLDKQLKGVLPVTYYHMVFTLPHELNGWVKLHPKTIYRLLFRVVWKTLSRFGQSPRRLNGQLGMTAILHTWGQNLSQHVHLHCLLPGGALTTERRWKPAKSEYLFPVRALSHRYRGAMVSALREHLNQGLLYRLTDGRANDRCLDTLMSKTWVVFCKPCLHRTEGILAYLARYTHRIAISNQRIKSVNGQQVTLDCRDYREAGRIKRITLEVTEFIRRYLQHILPKGLMRVRHYGYLANCCRKRRLEQIRAALLNPEPPEIEQKARQHKDWTEGYICRKCVSGLLQVVREIRPIREAYG